jgi:hypothetical protein
MNKPMRLIALPILFLYAAAAGMAAGPVYVRTTASAIVLGNDFLERTISIADGDAGTRQLVNKITGSAYALRGAEFELKLTTERVGYSFGGENPRVVTAAGMRVASHQAEDTAGGGKRVTLHLAQARGMAVDVVYELKPDDFYTRQWIHIAKPGQGTYFIDWVAPAKNEWGVPRFSLGGYGQPLFADDLFLGLEYPTGINSVSGAEVTLGGYVGIDIPTEGFTSEAAVMGVAPAALVHRQFLDYVARMRVAPVRPFLLYNSWYDLQRLAMNHDNTLARVPDFQKMLLSKYGLHLDSFVLDDGWDDMHKLWQIDPQRFRGIEGHRQPPGPVVRTHRRVRSAARAHRHRQGRGHGDHFQRPVLVHRRQELQPAAFRRHAEIPKGIRRQLFQAGWHVVRMQPAGPRPPGGDLFRRGRGALADWHDGQGAGAGS